MLYFYPDNQDYVDPRFDFQNEKQAPDRIPQRDDRYAHEMLVEPPYDGLLVSRAVIQGLSGQGRYSLTQRERLRRVGIHEFLRYPSRENISSNKYEIMGDCGAFSYVNESIPPIKVKELHDFYDQLGFDYGISLDHIILGFNPKYDSPSLFDTIPDEFKRRQNITMSLAEDFFRVCKSSKSKFIPIGVAQGWSPNSYRYAVEQLLKVGYDYIALGGMITLRTKEILSVLKSISEALPSSINLHLLGIGRTEHLEDFSTLGVTSFDSTSPLRKAFKDPKDNYFSDSGKYVAIRIPQASKHIGLKKLILAGRVNQTEAFDFEKRCLNSLRDYDSGKVSLEHVIEVLKAYYDLINLHKLNLNLTVKTLKEKPWNKCKCKICQDIGVEVIIFRGSERNRRRGFHNLYTFYQTLKKTELEMEHE
ncbi:hypothetical protein K8I28_06100 [bacterium]|nr:hypothetical protein [bacterium]